jgi:ankyrin repeat protein
VASVYELDSLTINEEAEDLEFDFDNEIVNSAAYRAAFQKQSVRNTASESRSTLQSPQSPRSSKPSFSSPFSRKSSGNASSWDQASTITPSEATQESKDKKKSRWSFVPLAKTISENAQAKKEHAQLQEKLCTAASKGDLILVQELVECGADPAEKRKKNHCLLNAIEAGSADVVKFLLKHGADPNSRDYESGLACLGAAFYKHPENMSMLSTLLEYGADTKDSYDIGDKQDKETSGVGNIFHLCAKFSDEIPNIVAIAKLFLEYNTESLDEYCKINGQKTYTPLQLACAFFEPGASENNERLKALIAAYIAQGAYIHEPFGKKVKIGATDIFIKFCSDEVDHHDLIKFLLDQGANPNVSNTAEGLETSPLHHACMAGLVETARVLVEHGAAVDAKSVGGVRPLHCAVSYKHLELVSLLIDHGADLEATTTKEGMTPLLLACEDPNTPLSIIERLVAANADVEALDQNKMTPLLFVCGSRKEVVEYLVESGANIEAKGGQVNLPPLHQAAGYDNDAVVKYLIQKGADLTSTDEHGETAVHRASKMCALDALRVLIAKGANVNAVNTLDDTPLHLVIEYWEKGDENLVEIVEFLLASGANPQAKNDEDLSPFEVLEQSVDIPSSQKRKLREALKSEYQF